MLTGIIFIELNHGTEDIVQPRHQSNGSTPQDKGRLASLQDQINK